MLLASPWCVLLLIFQAPRLAPMATGRFFLSSTALCTEIVDNFPGGMMRVNARLACFAAPGGVFRR